MQVTRPREVPVPEPQQFGGQSRLYLEDLAVGRRFTSAAHTIDTAQIKAFAGQFDPPPIIGQWRRDAVRNRSIPERERGRLSFPGI